MGVWARVLLGALTVASMGATAPARADAIAADAPAADTFDAAFFSQYSPNTAMDLLGHVPGFAIEDGGGAAANVLIDGQRPARSQQLNTLLSHIPAAQVVRVEILRGAQAASAAPGRTVVANIIRSASAGDGVWNVGAEFADGDPSPRGSFAWNGRTGAIEYGFGATYQDQDRPQHAQGVTYDANGEVTETKHETGARTSRQRGVTAQASAFVGDGGRLSLNAEASERRNSSYAAGLQYDADQAPAGSARRSLAEAEHTYELGATFEHDVGRWSGSVDGVLNRADFASDEDKTDDNIESHVTDRTLEGSLLRGTLAQEVSDTQRLEIGVEHAAESVDAHRESVYAGADWQSVNAGDVHVEQEHAEAYATHLWQVAPHWSVETHVAREMASLRFADETAQAMDFGYWTGSVQVTRELGRRSQIRARVLREPGRIDSEDIIETLADNPTPGGIPDLRPDMTWRAEIKTDLRFGRRGSLGLQLSHAWIDDVLERIVVEGPSGPFDAPGNIGEGEVDALDVNLSTPVKLVPHASFNMSGGVANSEVTDPLTSRPRSLLGVPDAHVWMEFRQEVPTEKFSWGLSYYQSTPGYWIGSNQLGSWQGGPSVDAFFETTAIDGVKARFRASSVLDAPARVEQLTYTPDRAGTLERVERTDTYSGTTFTVSLAGSF
ncbi:MAG TPA: hypothetical protein VG841_15580 [Caulobacterales bacterium]|nr:hypothetical protein [Caulobacterales bacterium]